MASENSKSSARPSGVRQLEFDETTTELRTSGLFKVPARDNKNRDQPYLLIIGGPGVGKMYHIERDKIFIGRSSEADIVLADNGVSRMHARIERRENGDVLLFDNGSTNGLLVNGRKIGEHLLNDGDRVRIGSSTILKFSYQDELEENFQRHMYESVVRDALTGVFNKRFFHDSLRTDFAYHARHGGCLSIVMMDVDHFKKVNDTYGHPAGDIVLQEVARLAEQGLRTEDVLCRYGGEEFALILRGTDTDEAVVVCERIRKAVSHFEFDVDADKIRVTVSLGIATLKDGNFEQPEALVEKADKYLYAAKNAGRNRTAYKRQS